ncbi:hypothetical protein EVAR_20660_1 [Eumeta japonica]|uniref:Uncharacterized protein n=1 Tax=Eumeta variegata TaxID=151549 RepID=A0A4C1VCY7_EUMVA|nr:hypothetical protein EVAR_20660_1 [Eumeta japonica]
MISVSFKAVRKIAVLSDRHAAYTQFTQPREIKKREERISHFSGIPDNNRIQRAVPLKTFACCVQATNGNKKLDTALFVLTKKSTQCTASETRPAGGRGQARAPRKKSGAVFTSAKRINTCPADARAVTAPTRDRIEIVEYMNV